LTVFLILSLIFLADDILWAIARKEVVSINFLLYYLHFYFPFHSICLIFFNQITEYDYFKKLFSWKILLVPFLCLIIYACFQWQFDPARNMIQNFGLRWQWCAIIEWSLLFIIQLILYQKKGLDNVLAFINSYYAVFLASVIYELPWYVTSGRWVTLLFFPIELLVATCFILIIHKMKWKFTWLLIPACIPLFILYVFYYSLPPTFGWLPRLTAFPLFLLFPFSLQKIKP